MTSGSQDMQSPLPEPGDGRRMLRIGWLIDGQGGAVQTDQCLTIEKGRVRSVEPFQPESPLRDTMIDLTRATVIPALMDAHVHLTLSGTLDEKARCAQTGQSDAAADKAVHQHLRAHLDSGVLAVRDAGDPRSRTLRMRQALEVEAAPVTLAATCWAWHAPGRYGKMLGQPPDRDTPLALAVARTGMKMDHIKVIQSGINSLDRFGHETPPQFTREALADLRRYALQHHLPVMVHANGALPVRIALDAGCDSIEHGYFMGSENLQRMADRQVSWVPTAVPMAALTQTGVVSASRGEVARRTLAHQLGQIATAHEIGVPIVLGTDAGSVGVDHGKAVRQELALLVRAGLTLSQAVQCATANAARLMGLRGRGSLQPGRRADFIVVKGAPEHLLQGLEEITALCIQGKWYDPAKTG